MFGTMDWGKFAKASTATLLMVLLSLHPIATHPAIAAWGKKAAARTETQQPSKLTGKIMEVAPPAAIQELRQAFDDNQPQVKIVSPRSQEVVEDDTVAVQFQVKDLPLFKNKDLGLGPHLHVFLDNQPYQAVYDATKPLVLEKLTPGTHTIRAFASRPWHESFKNEGAYAQTTFHIFTKTGENSPDANLPLLTYSRPQAAYGAEPVMLDFYLTNAPLHLVAQESKQDDIADWRIRCTVNGSSFVLDEWQPIWLKGLKPGKNWVQLEFLDENGNPVKNAFNNTARVITYEPGGKDTLSQLVRGDLPVSAARGIVDADYRPPTPTPSPTVTPVAKPSPSLSPAPVEPVTPPPAPVVIPVVPSAPVSKPAGEDTSPKVEQKPKAVEAPKPVASPKVVEPPKAIASPKPVASPKVVEPPKAIATPKPVESPKAIESPKPIAAPAAVETPAPSAAAKSAKSPVKDFMSRFRKEPREKKPIVVPVVPAPSRPDSVMPAPTPVASPKAIAPVPSGEAIARPQPVPSPKVEVPQVETPKVETLKVETPKVETPPTLTAPGQPEAIAPPKAISPTSAPSPLQQTQTQVTESMDGVKTQMNSQFQQLRDRFRKATSPQPTAPSATPQPEATPIPAISVKTPEPTATAQSVNKFPVIETPKAELERSPDSTTTTTSEAGSKTTSPQF